MTYAEWKREDTRLREVLADAIERGDYFLEMDTTELLLELNRRYQEEE